MLTRNASLGALVGVLFLACNDDSKEVEVVGPLGPSTEEVGPSAPTTEEVSRGPLSAASLSLPFSATGNSGIALFSIRQVGSGLSGNFEVDSRSHLNPALRIASNGSGPAVMGFNTGTGPAGRFAILNTGNPSPALEVTTQSATGPALSARTEGNGNAILGFNAGLGAAARFGISSTSNPIAAVDINTFGTGPALEVNRFSSGSLAVFQFQNSNRIRFTHSGKGIFNGGTQTGGADVAEAMAIEGRMSAYEPGDVLVISTRSDRTVEKTGEPYSTRVIGVYATNPGVLLTERGVDENLEGLVPVGVVGILPTKVSAENGAIRRGDLLVSAGTAGYAMRADPDRLRFGTVLGKALSEWTGPEKGVIPVFVNVK